MKTTFLSIALLLLSAAGTQAGQYFYGYSDDYPGYYGHPAYYDSYYTGHPRRGVVGGTVEGAGRAVEDIGRTIGRVI